MNPGCGVYRKRMTPVNNDGSGSSIGSVCPPSPSSLFLIVPLVEDNLLSDDDFVVSPVSSVSYLPVEEIIFIE